MKTCIKCNQLKEDTEFRLNPRHSTRRRNGCRACEVRAQHERYVQDPEKSRLAARKWSREHPEKRNATKRGWYSRNKVHHKQTLRKRMYGILPEEFEQRLLVQNNSCAVCGNLFRVGARKGPYVDHAHDTGEVRGLLCGTCNAILGFSKDSTEVLTNAINYLVLSKNSLYKTLLWSLKTSSDVALPETA